MYSLERIVRENGYHVTAHHGSLPFIVAAFMPALFVSSLYLFREQRRHLLSRDNPTIVRMRMVGVCAATVVALGLWYFMMGSVIDGGPQTGRTGHMYSELLGLGNVGPVSEVVTLLATLFLGPIATMLYEFDLSKYRAPPLIYSLRNYFIGPLTEEAVFRAAVVPLWLIAGHSARDTILYTPIFFGLAHAHHAWEVYNRSSVKFERGIVRRTQFFAKLALSTLFQFAYTTVFGWFAAWLFLATGSLFTCFVAHSFCNFMGFPQLQFFTTHKGVIGRCNVYFKSLLLCSYA